MTSLTPGFRKAGIVTISFSSFSKAPSILGPLMTLQLLSTPMAPLAGNNDGIKMAPQA